jgi:hypothetical protein
MASCEKCWNDAYVRMINNPDKSQSQHYHDLLEERKNNPCNEEQNRNDATVKVQIDIKKSQVKD